MREMPNIGNQLKMKQIPEHARFRVDPKKIRIGIRCVENAWLVSADDAITGKEITYSYKATPEAAIMYVLDDLNSFHVDGYNSDLMVAYPHPQYSAPK
jgi:hypothetical protein